MKRKKWKAFVLAGVLSVLCMLPVNADSYVYAIANTRSADLMIHSWTSTSSSTIGYLPKGGICRVLEENLGKDGKWSYIYSGGIKGYVASFYLSKDLDMIKQAEPIEGIVFLKDACIYKEKNEGSAVISKRFKGATEIVLSEDSGWYEIEFRIRDTGKTTTGWVSGKDVKRAKIVLDAEPAMLLISD